MSYTQRSAVGPTPGGTTVVLSAPSAAGAGNGDAIPVGSCLLVDNASGAAITLTIKAARTYLGHTLSDTTVSVATGATVLVGPFGDDPYGVQSGADIGRVHVEYSSVTSVTRAVLSV